MAEQHDVVTATDVAAMRHALQRLDPTVPADTAGGSVIAAGTAGGGVGAPAAGATTGGVGVPAPVADPARGGHGLSQAQCIDLLRELEALKAAAAGAQAAVTAHLARSRRAAEEAAGVPARHRGRGLAAEVALARRVSPHRGGRHLGLATTLSADMPHTLAALRSGRLSEWRATLLVRESICLGPAERRAVDEELCADLATVDAWGDRRLVAEARRVAYRLAPHSVVERARRAEGERCVTLRPAPDTMAYLTALLPVAQGVAVLASLRRAADSARAGGDGRSRGQVMADTLVERLTGNGAEVPAGLEVQLVMSDRSLFAGGDEPAELPGHGAVPAAWARELVARALNDGDGCGVWLRRVLTDPADRLVAMESRARRAPQGLAHYVTVRDGGTCRTPHCDAPVRHIDHVVDHSRGGTTSAENLQGHCERCNYTKSVPGWRAGTGPPGPAARGRRVRTTTDPPGHGPARPPGDPDPRVGRTVLLHTPTGHVYRSPVPRLPRAKAP